MSVGKLFQSLIVVGKKLFWYAVVDEKVRCNVVDGTALLNVMFVSSKMEL